MTETFPLSLILPPGSNGFFVSAYILNTATPPPPPVPFPGNPQTGTPNLSLYMRYSNDGGHTWSNYRPKGLV